MLDMAVEIIQVQDVEVGDGRHRGLYKDFVNYLLRKKKMDLSMKIGVEQIFSLPLERVFVEASVSSNCI